MEPVADTVTRFCPPPMLDGEALRGTWAARVWLPAPLAPSGVAGPHVVGVRRGIAHLTSFRTMADLINHPRPLAMLAQSGREIGAIDEIAAHSVFTFRQADRRDEARPFLLAPNDLSATRACGVTFARSLLERVVEEKARGNPDRAKEVRLLITSALGSDLSQVVPGSPATDRLREKLISEGLWSQYLEVGIGPDAEIFTKAQPMASVGYGAQIGIRPESAWNNPEPEVVLAVSRHGRVVGATLGNDVNLRDYEGRSALLLGEAKDQNGSCAVGPLLRLFDDTFRLEDIVGLTIELTVTGADGFVLHGQNRMAEISRPPAQLVAQAIGRHHQYPDGLMLFLGTMFAPTQDRGRPGAGFTHHLADRVEISTPALGRLVNWVNHTDAIRPWDYGIGELFAFLSVASRISDP